MRGGVRVVFLRKKQDRTLDEDVVGRPKLQNSKAFDVQLQTSGREMECKSRLVKEKVRMFSLQQAIVNLRKVHEVPGGLVMGAPL